MNSVLRPARKRKKVRKLGPVDIIRGEAYADLELDAKRRASVTSPARARRSRHPAGCQRSGSL